MKYGPGVLLSVVYYCNIIIIVGQRGYNIPYIRPLFAQRENQSDLNGSDNSTGYDHITRSG